MYKKWDTVDLLRHVRHDWLNRLQLIKGNLMLDKPGRAKKVIDEIVIRAKQEAKLTNLNMSDLAGILLTFNWSSHRFLLDFEVIGEERDLSWCEPILLNWLHRLFHFLDTEADETNDNHLLITFLLLEKRIRIAIDFNGKIIDVEKGKMLELEAQKTFMVVECKIGNDELVITLELKESEV